MKKYLCKKCVTRKSLVMDLAKRMGEAGNTFVILAVLSNTLLALSGFAAAAQPAALPIMSSAIVWQSRRGVSKNDIRRDRSVAGHGLRYFGPEWYSYWEYPFDWTYYHAPYAPDRNAMHWHSEKTEPNNSPIHKPG